MARILRGDIRWAQLSPVVGHEQGGRRPFLVLSEEGMNATLGIVIGLAVTSKEPIFRPPLSYEFPVGLLPQRSWILVFQVRSLSVQRLGVKLASLSDEALNEVLSELMYLIGGD